MTSGQLSTVKRAFLFTTLHTTAVRCICQMSSVQLSPPLSAASCQASSVQLLSVQLSTQLSVFKGQGSTVNCATVNSTVSCQLPTANCHSVDLSIFQLSERRLPAASCHRLSLASRRPPPSQPLDSVWAVTAGSRAVINSSRPTTLAPLLSPFPPPLLSPLSRERYPMVLSSDLISHPSKGVATIISSLPSPSPA